MAYSILLRIVLWCIQKTVETIYIPIRFLRFFKTSKKCPPINNDLLLLSASEVAHRIRKKQVRSVDIVKAYISRIQEVNPLINAVIETRFPEALKEAKKVDDFLKSSTLDDEEIRSKYPLLGVPITIKGSIALTGMIHGAGRVDYKLKAEKDATCVKYAREAGAIPLLTSNVPELCLNWETTNKFIGTTSNPYDLNRTPGGSSGGEASLLGCGASLIGLGTDVAGSLRLPAHCCGIWGHKPSPYAVSTKGHHPDCSDMEKWPQIFMMGPIARYATDLKMLFKIIVEPSRRDLLKLELAVDVKKLKVYYMDDPKGFLAHPFDTNVTKAIEKVITHFDIICDSKCTKVELPLMKYCNELANLPFLHVKGVEGIFDNKQPREFLELLKFCVGKSDHEFMTVGYEILSRNVPLIFSRHMGKVYKTLQKLREEFLKILGNDGVFVFPVCTTEASYKGDYMRRLFDNAYCTIFNALGFPATACPVMISPNGLPIGIQVVSGPDLDRLTLSVAEELERAFGGWKFI